MLYKEGESRKFYLITTLKIQGNRELHSLRVKIDALIKAFATELEQINNEVTPNFIRLQKRRSNIIYYIVMTLFLLLFISIAVFLEVLYAFYLILLLYGINLVLTGIGVFFLRRTNKEFYIVKTNWDAEYSRVLKYQSEANDLYEKVEQEVYKVITLTINHEELEKMKDDKSRYDRMYENKLKEVKLDIAKELGADYTSQDVVLYYTEWEDKLTSEKKSDFDFLEARKRKAELRSGEIDIDSE